MDTTEDMLATTNSDEATDDSDLPDPKQRTVRAALSRRGILRDLQEVKLELQERQLTTERERRDHDCRLRELEDELDEARRERDVARAKLKFTGTDDTKLREEVRDVALSLSKLERANASLRDQERLVRRDLANIRLSANEYSALCGGPEVNLTLSQFVKKRIFEELEQAHSVKERSEKLLTETQLAYSATADQLVAAEGHLIAARRDAETLRATNRELESQVAAVKSQLETKNYKLSTYDSLKEERDALLTDNGLAKKQFSDIRDRFATLQGEKTTLDNQLSELSRTVSLLEADKTHLQRTVASIGSGGKVAEERINQLSQQLSEAKLAREQLVEKLMAQKTELHSHYEGQMTKELASLKMATEAELTRIQTSARELHDRETRVTREARDMAAAERDRALARLSEAEERVSRVEADAARSLDVAERRATEATCQLRIKSFEADRAQLVGDETTELLEKTKADNGRLAKKLEIITAEYYQMKCEAEKTEHLQESQLRDAKSKLKHFHDVENQLDELVVSAADSTVEADALLGGAAHLPAEAKRRIQQSVRLSKRVLDLEKANKLLAADVEVTKIGKEEALGKIQVLEETLSLLNQPHQSLLTALHEKETALRSAKSKLEESTQKEEAVSTEFVQLRRERAELADDLARLLAQKDEFSKLRAMLVSVTRRGPGSREESAIIVNA